MGAGENKRVIAEIERDSTSLPEGSNEMPFPNFVAALEAKNSRWKFCTLDANAIVEHIDRRTFFLIALLKYDVDMFVEIIRLVGPREQSRIRG